MNDHYDPYIFDEIENVVAELELSLDDIPASVVFDAIRNSDPIAIMAYVKSKEYFKLPHVDQWHNQVFYLCDRKACGEDCASKQCRYTYDISHAKNFEKFVRTAAPSQAQWFERDDYDETYKVIRMKLGSCEIIDEIDDMLTHFDVAWEDVPEDLLGHTVATGDNTLLNKFLLDGYAVKPDTNDHRLWVKDWDEFARGYDCP